MDTKNKERKHLDEIIARYWEAIDDFLLESKKHPESPLYSALGATIGHFLLMMDVAIRESIEVQRTLSGAALIEMQITVLRSCISNLSKFNHSFDEGTLQ